MRHIAVPGDIDGKRVLLDGNKLLEIYMYADQIMHSRIQSFALTQTFFLLACATVFSTLAEENAQAKVAFLVSLCLFSAFTSHIQMGKLLSIHNKIIALRRLMLPHHAEFRTYLDGFKGSFVFGFTRTTPYIIFALWSFLLLLTLYGQTQNTLRFSEGSAVSATAPSLTGKPASH